MVQFKKNLRYQVDLSWDGESGGFVGCENCDDLKVDVPREFTGLGRSPCPDQLFLASIGGCLLTTFLHFKGRFKIDVVDVNISIFEDITLIRSEGYRIRSVKAAMCVKGKPGDADIIKRCAELAKDYCHITKSIEGCIPLDVSVEVIF